MQQPIKPNPISVKTRTPWGPAQQAYRYGRGITLYSTASHGGFKVSSQLNELIPEPFRNPKGYYEEDCEAAIVVATWPELFGRASYDQAIRDLRDYYPRQWEALSGQPVRPADSHVVRRERFIRENPTALVVVSAFGAWHEKVPAGKVGVLVCPASQIDCDRRDYSAFLVPEAEYDQRQQSSPLGFIVDPDRHEALEGNF